MKLLSFPPTIKPAAVRKLVEEYQRLNIQLADHTAIAGVISDAERAHRTAEQGDKEKLATAFRRGQEATGEKKEPSPAERHQTTLEAIALAKVQCERDLVAAVAAARDQWLTDLAAEEDKARKHFAELVESLADAHQRRAEIEATIRWVQDFPRAHSPYDRVAYNLKLGQLSSWRMPGGNSPGMPDVFMHLREIAKPAVERRILVGPGSGSENLNPDRARMTTRPLMSVTR